MVLITLCACTSPGDDSASLTDDATGQTETHASTEDGSSSGASSTPGVGTTGGTTAAPSTSATDPSETDTTIDESATSGSGDPGSSSSAETSDETGTSATDSDSGPSAECTELLDCCDQIGADLYPGCSAVVQMENAGLCDSILANYFQEGYCTGETYCAELGDCCPELPPGVGWQDTCEYYADFGNQPQCAMLIGDYQLSSYCL